MLDVNDDWPLFHQHPSLPARWAVTFDLGDSSYLFGFLGKKKTQNFLWHLSQCWQWRPVLQLLNKVPVSHCGAAPHSSSRFQPWQHDNRVLAFHWWSRVKENLRNVFIFISHFSILCFHFANLKKLPNCYLTIPQCDIIFREHFMRHVNRTQRSDGLAKKKRGKKNVSTVAASDWLLHCRWSVSNKTKQNFCFPSIYQTWHRITGPRIITPWWRKQAMTRHAAGCCLSFNSCLLF